MAKSCKCRSNAAQDGDARSAANAALNPDKTRIVPLNFAATAEDGEFTFGSGDPSYGIGGIVGFTHNKPRNTRYTLQVTGKTILHLVTTSGSNAVRWQ